RSERDPVSDDSEADIEKRKILIMLIVPLLPELDEFLDYLERALHRPWRSVTLSKKRKNAVAQELVHNATVLQNLLCHGRQKRTEQFLHFLIIEHLTHLGKAPHIAEEQG